MTLAEATDWVVRELGQPRFRGEQVWRWAHGKGARTFDDMTDVPAGLRAELATRATLGTLGRVQRHTSRSATHKRADQGLRTRKPRACGAQVATR